MMEAKILDYLARACYERGAELESTMIHAVPTATPEFIAELELRRRILVDLQAVYSHAAKALQNAPRGTEDADDN
jgi:hypothetical protein